LETLDNNSYTGNNELTQALQEAMSTANWVIHLPKIIAKIYFKLSRRQRQAQATIERYMYQTIDHELATSFELIEQRKRISLIASLVGALQKDEKSEATKSEEEKKGERLQEILRQCFNSYYHMYHSGFNLTKVERLDGENLKSQHLL